MGAQELRQGPLLPPRPVTRLGYLHAMNVDQILDSMAVRLKAEDVGGVVVTLNLRITDAPDEQDWALGLRNCALHQVAGRHDDGADATLTMDKHALEALSALETTLADAVAAGDVELDGDADAAGRIFDHLDVFLSSFGLVEP
jgi:alkyl sulfatase BDS1-like metallo-beta-lactamase superfamily hydrolase